MTAVCIAKRWSIQAPVPVTLFYLSFLPDSRMSSRSRKGVSRRHLCESHRMGGVGCLIWSSSQERRNAASTGFPGGESSSAAAASAFFQQMVVVGRGGGSLQLCGPSEASSYSHTLRYRSSMRGWNPCKRVYTYDQSAPL